MPTTEGINSEAAILGRVIQAERDNLPRSVARALLKLGFTREDRDRMQQLAVKNQDGTLTEVEERELDSYRRVGRLLDLLAARARLSLAKHGRSA